MNDEERSEIAAAAVKTLKEFQAKAGCMHTQHRANQLWEEVRPLLHADEVGDIRVAWNHHLIGEGRAGLDKVVDKVSRRFRGLVYRYGK